ncbi:hypothetical protein [Nostoc sp. JL33]|nr:hypothetical protein [Nostoc sp. JL33]MBN3871646.1 hypothetical protein [Nostoc sp. JL33]
MLSLPSLPPVGGVGVLVRSPYCSLRIKAIALSTRVGEARRRHRLFLA